MVLHVEQILLGRANNADPRAVGLPALAPTALASADEAERRKGLPLEPRHCRECSAHSGVCQAQAGSHAEGPRENCQNLLLECTEPELRVRSRKRPGHSCSPQAQVVLEGSTHWKVDLPLAWAVTEVSAEVRRILGSYMQRLCEA